MTPAQQQLVDTVLERFGAKAVTTDAREIAPWESDWRGRYHGSAPALFSPGSTAEVAEIIRLAGELGVKIVPQGGNTGMVGGATPSEDGSALLLSTRRMNAIRSIDPVGNVAVVEAGVILANFHNAALEQGRRFPLTLGAKGSATIGGLVSTNAGGTQVLRFGNMRHLVAGLEAVLPDGSIYEGLTPLKKDNRGYDLTQLLIGAEGTIGIVTAATLQLHPAILERAAAWVGVASPEDALRMLRLMEARTNTIESFEIIPGEILRHVLDHIPGTRSPLAGEHAWHVLIESVATEAGAEPPAALLGQLLEPVFESGLAEDAVISSSEAQVEAFWHIRDSISEAERALGPAMQHDISVPVDKMPGFMVKAAEAAERRFPGVTATGFGHLGDGNVHFHVRAPAGVDRDSWYAGDGKAVSRFVYDMVVAEGGSISAEHGIGQMKRDELVRLSPPQRIAALKAIKMALDPRGILNPGKLVALAPEADNP
ncbi:FAD/FMN-containing dehydrogenase [Sphingomonas kyeonggiensis]|uniref:FAD/FMN-containing dehydrogenase n=1 Tax=Sphingomonas kyeonggiensis TaxID=1268553 RepID=A0A7W7K4X2_9SPHN|nr:FAD-binding oxidoreductase [Sphingomonas kyeonggiensis]MBB4841043.1 FAD/FMN-containing dehydrogenase [Sphingomonas kyeonggiensis]